MYNHKSQLIFDISFQIDLTLIICPSNSIKKTKDKKIHIIIHSFLPLLPRNEAFFCKYSNTIYLVDLEQEYDSSFGVHPRRWWCFPNEKVTPDGL